MQKLARVIMVGSVALFCSEMVTTEGAGAEDALVTAVNSPDFIVGGTGCKDPQSVVGAFIDFDFDGFPDLLRFRFSDYLATKGPEVSIVDNRRNCAMRLTVTPQAGWQLGIIGAKFGGFADLPAGVVARVQSIYEYPISKDVALQAVVTGPQSGEYRRGDVLGDYGDVVWSPCGTPSTLAFNTDLRLSGDNSVSSSASLTDNVYWLHWRECL
jgi:hypothetical protein